MSHREVNLERAGDADSNREDYVHMRAKRGQATNNHSLAERVINLSSNIIVNTSKACGFLLLIVGSGHLKRSFGGKRSMRG